MALADLQQFIFTTEYNPQRTSTGKAELTFIKNTGMRPCLGGLVDMLIESDAKDFMKVVSGLSPTEKADMELKT